MTACFLRIPLRGKFKLNGGLALISGLPAYAQHGADRVKEAACAGRRNCLDLSFRHHALYFRILRIADGQLVKDPEISVSRSLRIILLFFTDGPDHGRSDPPSLTGGAVPANLKEGLYGSGPGKSMAVRKQDLAAPDRPVCSIPRAIEGHADHPVCAVIFRQAGQDVGIVMLDAVQRYSFPRGHLFRHSRGIVFRMKIADNGRWRDFQKVLHARHSLLQSPHSAQILEIPHIR